MFSRMIARASTLEEISTGVTGTRDGALLLVSVEHYPVSICTSFSCLQCLTVTCIIATDAGRATCTFASCPD
jgi:hypothetical protein